MPSTTAHRSALAALLLLTALIAGTFLTQDMWADELRTVFYAGAVPQYGPTTVDESLDRLEENLWQAPAYYLFLWGWGRLAGWSVFALRLPSVIFGLITILLTYDLTRQMASRRVAFYAAFLLAFGAFFVNFLHDMRAYTLFTAFTALMLWSYFRLLHPKSQSVPLLGMFLLSVTGLLYTHFFAAFPIAALGLCHLIFQRKHRLFWPILAAFVVSGVLFLPWAQVLLGGAELATEVPRRVINLSALEIVQTILYFFSNGASALSLVLLSLVLGSRPQRRGPLAFIIVWLMLGGGLLWLVTRVIPALTDAKYMLFLWPGLAVVLAHGVQQLEQRGIRPIVIPSVWALMFLYSLASKTEQLRIHPWYRAPFTELAQTLAPLTTQEDSVLFVDPTQEGYIDNSMLSYYLYDLPLHNTNVVLDGFATNDETFTGQARVTVQTAQRVWLAYDVQSPNWRTDVIAQTTLPDAGFSACGSLPESERLLISLFARPPENGTVYTFHSDNSQDAAQISLLTEPRLTAEGTLFVVTGSQVSAEMQGAPYSLAVHLEDDQGQLVAQADSSLGQADFNCQIYTLDMSQLAAGHYTLKVAVYNWQTGARLISTVPSVDERPVVASVVVPD